MQTYSSSYEITNIVANGSFSIRPDKIILENIKTNNDNISLSYNSKKFPAIIIKMKNPKCTILFFASSKFVITGLRDIDNKQHIIDKIKELFKYNKIHLDKYDIIVQNIVAVGKVGNNINLDEANIKLNNVIYEPENFPGMILHDSFEPYYKKATMLIFSSGKAVCVGLNSIEKIDAAFENIEKKIENQNLNESFMSPCKNYKPVDINSLIY